MHCQSPNELAHSQGGRPSWLLQAQSEMRVLLVQKGGSGRPALAWLWLIMPPSASSDTMRCDAAINNGSLGFSPCLSGVCRQPP